MKQGKRIAALLLALLCVGALALQSAAPAAAVTKADIDALKSQAAETASKKSELQKKLTELKGQSADALSQKAVLDQQSDLIRTEIDNAETQISSYEKLIVQTEVELEQAKLEEQSQYEVFCARVRSMEENGAISYWSVLFNSSSFTDLLGRLDAINEIMEYDNNVFNALRALRQEIEEKQAELENDLAETEAQKKLLVSKQAELDAQVAEAAELIGAISETSAEYNKLLRAEETEAASIAAQIKQAEDALTAANGGTKPPATYGGYIWPVSTSKYITSPFGPRVNPVSGKKETHKGVDIARVYYTSEVHAAKAGTVIISQYGSSYGNYVVVSHGTGNTTLYAHMSKRLVKVGDTVTQGQAIGITGSTGNSTGPHLHFEITENGGRINPLSYLTDYVKGWK